VYSGESSGNPNLNAIEPDHPAACATSQQFSLVIFVSRASNPSRKNTTQVSEVLIFQISLVFRK